MGGSARVEPRRLVAMASGWSGTSTRTKSAPSNAAMKMGKNTQFLGGLGVLNAPEAYPSLDASVTESIRCGGAASIPMENFGG